MALIKELRRRKIRRIQKKIAKIDVIISRLSREKNLPFVYICGENPVPVAISYWTRQKERLLKKLQKVGACL